MATILQTGQFAQGQIGYPLRVTVQDFTQVELNALATLTLKILRPDATRFDRTEPDVLRPAVPEDPFVYNMKDGDLSVDGHYSFTLVLNLTGGQVLPVTGTFDIGDVQP